MSNVYHIYFYSCNEALRFSKIKADAVVIIEKYYNLTYFKRQTWSLTDQLKIIFHKESDFPSVIILLASLRYNKRVL